jgi:hypothetical protein
LREGRTIIEAKPCRLFGHVYVNGGAEEDGSREQSEQTEHSTFSYLGPSYTMNAPTAGALFSSARVRRVSPTPGALRPSPISVAL